MSDLNRMCAWLELPEQRKRYGTPSRTNVLPHEPGENRWFVVIWGTPNVNVYGRDLGHLIAEVAMRLGWKP